MIICTACASTTCHRAQCVRDEMAHRFVTELRRLRERNDGHRMMADLDEIDRLISEYEAVLR